MTGQGIISFLHCPPDLPQKINCQNVNFDGMQRKKYNITSEKLQLDSLEEKKQQICRFLRSDFMNSQAHKGVSALPVPFQYRQKTAFFTA
jgi:hypothetical protein